MTHKRDVKNLNLKLTQQKKFLQASLNSFNQGNEDEAIRLAIAIRVLLYDTQNCSSLLRQLKQKNSMFFCSSVSKYIPTNQVSYLGLCGFRISNQKGDYYSTFADEDSLRYVFTNFNYWWNELIFDDKNFQFSRKDVVLFVANKDGGAHVDNEIPEKFYALNELNSLGFYVEIEDSTGIRKIPMSNNPIYCSIVSIAKELLLSLDIQLNFKVIKSNILLDRAVEVRSFSNFIYMVFSEKYEKDMFEIHNKLFADSNVIKTKQLNPHLEVLKHISKSLIIQRIVVKN
jgi:hypothetical protein